MRGVYGVLAALAFLAGLVIAAGILALAVWAAWVS